MNLASQFPPDTKGEWFVTLVGFLTVALFVYGFFRKR